MGCGVVLIKPSPQARRHEKRGKRGYIKLRTLMNMDAARTKMVQHVYIEDNSNSPLTCFFVV